MLVATLILGLAVIGSSVVAGEWRALAAGAVFLAYCIYVFFSGDDRNRLMISPWEMMLLGGASGLVIALLVHPGIVVALLGFVAGVLLGVFADRWTHFVKYL
jgi:hypothetical protein